MRVASVMMCMDDNEDKRDRISHAEKLIDKAAGADLILLPELWNVGFFSFDFTHVDVPAYASLSNAELHLNLTSSLANSLTIHVVVQSQSTGNAVEIIDNVYLGVELATESLQGNGSYVIALNVDNVFFDSGMLYIGLWAEVSFEDDIMAVFEPDKTYLLLQYELQE